jgi:hypothetical protein
MLHVGWLAIALLSLGGGWYLGFRAGSGVLGSLVENNKRFDNLGQVRLSLRLIGDNDIEVHRRSEDALLRHSLIELGVMPRYSPCRPKEANGMADAKRYLASHVDANHPEGDALTALGLSYCEKPEEERSPWFFLGI